MVEPDAGGKRAAGRDLSTQIVERTDGVPLFVEELTKSVLESGLLREQNGALPCESATVARGSDSLQASLMARLDRLGSCQEGRPDWRGNRPGILVRAGGSRRAATGGAAWRSA